MSEFADNAMKMLLDGKIKKHTLADDSSEQTELTLKKEEKIFKDFLPSKNAHEILRLKGGD